MAMINIIIPTDEYSVTTNEFGSLLITFPGGEDKDPEYALCTIGIDADSIDDFIETIKKVRSYNEG